MRQLLFVGAILLGFGPAGCASPRITGAKSVGGELVFQVDGGPEWYKEADLPEGVDRSPLATIKNLNAGALEQQASEARRRQEAWQRETPEQAAAEMGPKLPAGFTLETEAPYVVASDVGAAERKGLKQLFDSISRKCRDVRGGPVSIGPLRVYYARDEQGYTAAYTAVFGRAPAGFLGICSAEAPPRMFGLSSVGNGSLGHELAHILMMTEWPAMPGWLNEGLAVSLGCPLLGYRSEKVTVTDLHLYTALQAVKQGVWVPLEQAFQVRGTEYADLDHVKVKLPALGVSSFVGPLATGRMLVRWLDETGKLPAFYQAFRDSKDPAQALQRTFAGVERADVEKAFLKWVTGHEESSLFRSP